MTDILNALVALGTLSLATVAFLELRNNKEMQKREAKRLAQQILFCVTELQVLLNFLESPDPQKQSEMKEKELLWVVEMLRNISQNANVYLLDSRLRDQLFRIHYLLEIWRHKEFAYSALCNEKIPIMKKLRLHCKEITYECAYMPLSIKDKKISGKVKTFLRDFLRLYLG